jgi:hypothetical protein
MKPPLPRPIRSRPLRSRRDGWTADRQAGFVAARAAGTTIAAAAAAAVGMSRRAAYRLRVHLHGAGIAGAWPTPVSADELRAMIDTALDAVARVAAMPLTDAALIGAPHKLRRFA